MWPYTGQEYAPEEPNPANTNQLSYQPNLFPEYTFQTIPGLHGMPVLPDFESYEPAQNNQLPIQENQSQFYVPTSRRPGKPWNGTNH